MMRKFTTNTTHVHRFTLQIKAADLD